MVDWEFKLYEGRHIPVNNFITIPRFFFDLEGIV